MSAINNTTAKIANWTLAAPGYFTKPIVMRSKTAVVGMVRDLLEQGVTVTITPNVVTKPSD